MSDDFGIAESLLKLAGDWETTCTVSGTLLPGFRVVSCIVRCKSCSEQIFATGEHDGITNADVVRHLMTSHGYRMDGRQFDNQNRLVGHA